MLYTIGFKNLLHLSLSSQSEVKNRDCASLTYMFPCFMSASCFDWSPRVDPGFSRGGGRGYLVIAESMGHTPFDN